MIVFDHLTAHNSTVLNNELNWSNTDWAKEASEIKSLLAKNQNNKCNLQKKYRTMSCRAMWVLNTNLRPPNSIAQAKPQVRPSAMGPVRKAPSSLFTMAISPGTVALVACGLLHSLRIG